MTVASFYDGGGLRAELEAVPGVRVVSLGKRGRWDALPFLWRLLRELRAARPDVVHGYLSGANELSLLGRLVGARVVWGLRSSEREGAAGDPLARLIFRAGAALSSLADLIIANSDAGRRYHVANRYAGRRIAVVHNGIDTVRFRPDPEGRRALRAAWGVGEGEPLVGIVGRLERQKGHPNFLRAAGVLAARRPEARFVCVGEGPGVYTAELRALAEAEGLAGRLVWAGASDAMPAVYSALDVLVSASRSEGFANAIAEAMACGVPCAVTDVGDSALVVGAAGAVASPDDPAALAGAIEGLLASPLAERAALGRRARQRIEAEFSVARLAERTDTMLRGLVPWAG